MSAKKGACRRESKAGRLLAFSETAVQSGLAKDVDSGRVDDNELFPCIPEEVCLLGREGEGEEWTGKG